MIDVEHNFVEPRRTQIRDLLISNGYIYIKENTYDDCYKHSSLFNAMEEKVKYYGYNFETKDAMGLGAILNALLMANHYATVHGMKLAFVEEKMKVPFFNGSINDIDEPDKTFASYFKSLPVIKQDDIHEMWGSWKNKFYLESPSEGKEKRIIWYSKLMTEIFQLHDDILKTVEKQVNKYFNENTDIALHVRRTDKIKPYENSYVEASEIPVKEYFESTMRIIKKKFSDRNDIRVFLCTDDKSIIKELTEYFNKEGIELVYDKDEPVEEMHALRIAGKITKTAAWNENIIGLVNILIMSRALYLVGGRMSFLFRVSELLRYPKPTLNIKDQEKWGVAQYAEAGTQLINPQYPRCYPNFVSELKYECKIENNIFHIFNFMSPSASIKLLEDMKKFNNSWWTHSVKTIGRSACDYYLKTGSHYKTCDCYICRLEETFTSYDIIKVLSNIINKRIININVVATKYDKNNFVELQNDNKADYGFVLSLTENWNVSHGGIFNLGYDGLTYKSLPVQFNSLTVYKLTDKTEFFVSKVCGNNSLYSLHGHFSIDYEDK